MFKIMLLDIEESSIFAESSIFYSEINDEIPLQI